MNLRFAILSFLVVLIGLPANVVSAQEEPNPLPAAKSGQAFDWPGATAAFHKNRTGVTLTPAEQILLDEARKRRRAGERPAPQPAARVRQPASSNPQPAPRIPQPASRIPQPAPDAATRGDGSGDRSPYNASRVPAEDAPVQELEVTSTDGKKITIAYRVPAGEGPFPAILFFHGGMGQRPLRKLSHEALHGRTHNEFLRRGFVAVTATYRTYDKTPSASGPIEDAAAMVKAVAALPNVDANSVAVFGGSGGGSIVMELASEPDDLPLAAVIAGEPATLIYTGMLKTYAQRMELMDREVSAYTEEVKKHTEAKIARITRPILVHHGDIHALKHINFNRVFPAIHAAKKDFKVVEYPGENHGFYWGSRVSEENFEKLMSSSTKFLGVHLKVQGPGGRPTPEK